MPRESRFAALAFLLALATVMLAPLPLGANRPLFWAFDAVLCGTALALAGTAQLRGAAGPIGTTRELRIAAAIFAALIAWMAVQALLPLPGGLRHPQWVAAEALTGRELPATVSIYPTGTFDAILRWLSAGALFAVLLMTVRTFRRSEAALAALAGAGTAYALCGLVLHLNAPYLLSGVQKWAFFDFVTGPFVNPNNFATYLGMVLMILLALVLARIDAFQRRSVTRYRGGFVLLSALLQPATLAFTVMAVVVFLALLATGSRAGIASSAAGAVVVLVVFSFRSRERSGLATVTAAVLLATLVLGILVFIGGAMTGGSSQEASDFGNRAGLWRDSVTAMLDRPILGHGAGAFGEVFATYLGTDIHAGRTFRDAHNTYLELAVELGLPAALAAAAMFAALFLPVVRSTFRRGRPYAAPLAATGAMTVVAVHAFFDFSIQLEAIAFTFFAIVAIAEAQDGIAGNEEGDGASRPFRKRRQRMRHGPSATAERASTPEAATSRPIAALEAATGDGAATTDRGGPPRSAE
ncbi:O-antigen ligase family protein [Stappia sp. F7233]|uniref:O-antigen ligase family protein n=1 Tax=Stappia albiluteola TaxID=2758565 RepID=A0A839ADU9_9HYPH|nr:O-antigen ligase family protein [Stappia albiluteola]MBA5777134.1 O-antigen ligase family protein [Stappia albiluteola]